MLREILCVLEGGVMYLEIIGFGFINMSKGKEEKNHD